MNITSALIVDDSKMARITLKKHLESLNIKVFMVENGEQSLQFLKTHHPDVIFMDCLMPGIDGFETTRQISSNRKTASIPVIMCTGKETEEDKHKAMDAGAYSYMVKSSSSGPLKDILADLDKFDAQMSRITSNTPESKPEAAEEHKPETQQTPEKKTPAPETDKDALIKQTLVAVDSVLNSKLEQVNTEFSQLSKQFSALSGQLENKIIFSVKSSIKESHSYTDQKSAQLSEPLKSLRQDFDTFKAQIEAIDFDKLILENINNHFDQLLNKRQAELAQSVYKDGTVQTQLNEQIQHALAPVEEQLTSLEQQFQQTAEQEAQTGNSSSYISVAALLISLAALAACIYPFFK